MITKKQLIIIGSILILVMLLPLGFYIFNFSSSKISGDPQAWGVLGDYFGGVLNPIISLASLCTLGYLTHLVAETNNREAKNVFILERRMLAYDELAKHLKQINSLGDRIASAGALTSYYKQLSNEQAALYLIKSLEEIKSITDSFREFYYTLLEFNPRYGHLFKYDFKCEHYKNLTNDTKRISQIISKLVAQETDDSKKAAKELEDISGFLNSISNVIMALRKEVSINPDKNAQ